MTDRRSRTNSLPFSPSGLNEPIKRGTSPLHISTVSSSEIKEVEENFEADDEKSKVSTRRPSTVAKEEIDQARRLNEKMSSAPELIEVSITGNYTNGNDNSDNGTGLSKSNSMLGSIYSIGGAFWNFIRGPVETDSNDELPGNYRRKNKSKSFSASSVSSPKNPPPKLFVNDSTDEDFHTDSSDAPNFNVPVIANESETISKLRTGVEPGRDKVVFKEASESSCNLIGRDFPDNEHVLTPKDISSIQSQIPARWNVYNDWILLYSTRGNGFSLTTLYHQLKEFKGPVLIAVKDEIGSVFGAFVNQSLRSRQGHYGNGECFLWRKSSSDSYTKYPSTGKNNYFVISEPDYLAIGCGGGKFGLWLEKELFKGISDPVPTFDNEQLSTNQKFDCIAIEIWGLDLNE